MVSEKRKNRKENDIKKEIIDFIESLDFPTTTEQISKGVRINWYMARLYLDQLREEGKVFHKRIGRQNQWWTEKVDEQRKKIRELEWMLRDKDEKIRKQDDVMKELVKLGIVAEKSGRYIIKQKWKKSG